MNKMNIVKTILILAAMLIVCSLSVTVFADDGSLTAEAEISETAAAEEVSENADAAVPNLADAESESAAEDAAADETAADSSDGYCRCGKRSSRKPGSEKNENAAETRGMNRSRRPDFGSLPEDATDEEKAEFFKKYFSARDRDDDDDDDDDDKKSKKKNKKDDVEEADYEEKD